MSRGWKAYLPDLGQVAEDATELCCEAESARIAVAHAAPEYFQNGGDGQQWPATFVIIAPDGSESRFEVSMSMEVSFVVAPA